MATHDARDASSSRDAVKTLCSLYRRAGLVKCRQAADNYSVERIYLPQVRVL